MQVILKNWNNHQFTYNHKDNCFDDTIKLGFTDERHEFAKNKSKKMLELAITCAKKDDDLIDYKEINLI